MSFERIIIEVKVKSVLIVIDGWQKKNGGLGLVNQPILTPLINTW